ncbi:MAG: hypothetical protein ABW061_22370 [Polyangiaceae bacterium]
MQLSPPITHSVAREGQRSTTQLNRNDCRADDQISFPITLSGSKGLGFQAWAGSGCDQLTQRVTLNAGCWQLGQTTVAADGQQALSVSVRSILSGRTLASGSGTTGTGGPSADPLDACREPVPSSVPQTIAVYFLLVDGSENVQGTYATWNATYKLEPPQPPDVIAVGIGNENLMVEFGYSSLTADTTIQGFTSYCDPAPVSGAAPVASGTSAVCTASTLLTPGAEASPALLAQFCGAAGQPTSRITTGPLLAGVAYNLAVTATDSYWNQSVLSTLVCGVPDRLDQQTPEQRSAACAFSRRQQPLPLLSALSAISLLAARRHRRRISATLANS